VESLERNHRPRRPVPAQWLERTHRPRRPVPAQWLERTLEGLRRGDADIHFGMFKAD